MKLLNAVALFLTESTTAQVLPATTAQNYQSSLDQNALSAQNRCQAIDASNASITSGVTAPSCFIGYDLSKVINLNTQPPYNNNVSQFSSTCKGTSWCSASGGQFQQCSVKGDQVGQTQNTNMEQKCISMTSCDQFTFISNKWQYTSCPNLQCPAYMYRSGPTNQERNNGSYVFRKQNCIGYQNRLQDQRQCDVTKTQNQAASSGFNFAGHFQKLAPFQCIHDDCLATSGSYIQKGNTDTGPTSHLGGVSRVLIEPYWQSGISSFISLTSKSQGRCATCASYEQTTDPENIMSYGWDQYDGTTGKLSTFGQTSRQVGRGQLGCVRCADYQKRDVSTGRCRQHTCNGANQILVRNGASQGQCTTCTGNSVADSLRRTCVQCTGGQTVQQVYNAQTGQYENKCQTQYCEPTRSFTNAQGVCTPCQDYQRPPTAGSFLQYCTIPICPGQIVLRDSSCQSCSFGSTPDAQQRNCLQSACPDYQRRDTQTGGQCRSDSCYQGQQLVRNGAGQGTCIPCNQGQQSTYNYQGCQQTPCGANQSRDFNGICQTIPCSEYTRRQLDGQCRPDVCSSNERNVRFTENAGFNGQTLQQGYCTRCAQNENASNPDPVYSNARTSCVGITCPYNNIITASGQCQPCQLCETTDYNQSQCIPTVCSGRQFLSISNQSNQFSGGQQTCQCKDCDAYTAPASDNKSCLTTTCPTNSYRDYYGSCQLCAGGSKFVQSFDGISCIEKQCPERNQYIDNQGECRSCSAYEVVNYERTGCTSPQCNDRQVVTVGGQLEDCPAYTRTIRGNGATSDCRDCASDTCRDRQYLASNGLCYDCPQYQISDLSPQSRDQCVRPTCPQTSIITRNGLCQQCEVGQNPDQSQLYCTDVYCGLQQKIVTVNSVTTCEQCPTRTRAQKQNTICAADPCVTSQATFPFNQFTQEDGTCYSCGRYQIVNADRTFCVAAECADNQVVNEDGSCKTCPEFFRRVDYASAPGFTRQAECVECACNSQFGREYCLASGACATCGDYLLPTPEGRGCRRPDCPKASPVVQKDGSCGVCPAYNYFENDECVERTCPGRQRVTRAGECDACPDFFYLSDNARDCVQCNCKAGEICQADGSCKSCPAYELVQLQGVDAGKKCFRPECANGVLQRDGSCSACNQCEALNSAKTACVQPTCDSRSALQYGGKCLECPAYEAPTLLSGCDGKLARCEGCLATGRDIILKNGKCQECPDYYRISADRKTCSPAACTGNKYVDIEGNCIECGQYTSVDTDRRKCSNKCEDDQVVNLDGTCQTCPKYQRPGPSLRECIQDPCTSSQYFDEVGKCLECPSCTRSAEPRLKCFADTCSARQLQLSDGKCSECPSYQRPTVTPDTVGSCGNVCKEPKCGDRDILLQDGTCETCPDWTKPMSGGRVCGPDVCGTREKLLITGNCEECSDYTRGGGAKDTMQKQQYTKCLPDQCKEVNQILTKEGTCAYCAAYERAGPNQRTCAIPACGDRTRRLLPDATFEQCPDFTRATADCKACSPDPCTLREKLLKNGMCEACPNYQRATPDGRDCRTYPCEANQIRLIDGTCQQCPPFEISNDAALACQPVTCLQSQRLLPSGTCEDCEAYSRSMNDGKACAPNLCTQREKINPDGTCEACPDFSRASANGRMCVVIPCTARQILQRDGRCADCYPYTRADADGKICVPHNCTDRQKLGPFGACADCPAYERAQGTGLTCGPDTCNVRQRVLTDGTCKYCPLYQSVRANRRGCSTPTCKPNVEYISKDGICQQCAFHQQTGPDGTTCVTDPTKKLPDPQVIAPTPVTLQATNAPQEPACSSAAGGCDLWTDEQFLSEDQATGFYLNQQTGSMGFMLGNAVGLSSAVAALGTAVLIALNAL